MKKTVLLVFIIFFTCNTLNAQIVDIPDANFKNALMNTSCVDYDGDGFYESNVDLNNDNEIQLTEALGVPKLRIYNRGITSVEGLENFINLNYIEITFNNFPDMNVSTMPNLEWLLCYGNGLTSLDVSQNLNLKYLYCNENALTSIDVTQNTELIHLEVYLNQITSLDVTQNMDLVQLQCGNNPLGELNVENNVNLVTLTVREIGMEQINLMNNTQLEYLTLEQNELTSIDLTNNLQLQSLYIDNNQLETLDLSQNPNLANLNAAINNLTEINLKNGTLLDYYGGIFSLNPNLQFVCADDSEIMQIQNSLNDSGLTETMVSTDCNLGVDENILSEVRIYPNPAINEITIVSNSRLQSLELHDMHGKLLKKTIIDAFECKLELSDLSSGFYVLKIRDERGSNIKSIIKN